MQRTMIRTILHLSDTHGLHRKLGTLPDADVLVHSGDFTQGGTEEEAYDFMEWLTSLPHPYKIFIAGNHDDCLYQAHIEGLPQHTHYLCNSGIWIDDWYFYGMPLFVEDEINGSYEQQILAIPPETDILITHQPAWGIQDYSDNIHWGSSSLLKRIKVIHPRFHFFGHIHTAYGIERKHDTTHVNSAIVDNQCELSHPPTHLRLW